MNLILKTLSIGLLIAVAGCANSGTNTNPASLGAADNAPSCCGSCSKTKACSSTAEKASLGAAEDAPSCASSCSTSCKTKCDMSKKNMKMPKAKTPGSSLGAFDDAAKSKSSCCPSGDAGKKSGGCPFSGGN